MQKSEEGKRTEPTNPIMDRASSLLPPRTLQFVIPDLPPSVNSLYNVLFNLRKVEMKPEVRLWKTRAKEFIPPFKLLEKNSKLSIRASMEGSWFHSNKALKKKDVQNMMKVLIDAVAEKIGFDDSRIWMQNSYKVESNKEQVKVELFEYE